MFRTRSVTPGEPISISVGQYVDSVVSGSFGTITASKGQNGIGAGNYGGSGGAGYTGETSVAGDPGSQCSPFCSGGNGGGQAVANSISGVEVLYGGGGAKGTGGSRGANGSGQYGNGGGGGGGTEASSTAGSGGQGVVILRWTEPEDGTSISSYSFNSPLSTGTVDVDATTVDFVVPGGTDLTSLVADFSLSTGATLKQGTSVLTSGTSSVNYSSPVTMTVVAQNGDTRSWVVAVRYAQTVSWAPSNRSVAVAAGLLTPDVPATSDGDGGISYSVGSAGTTGCTVNSSTGVVSFTSPGTCSITATAAQTETYAEGATLVSFTVAAPVSSSPGSGGGSSSPNTVTVIEPNMSPTPTPATTHTPTATPTPTVAPSAPNPVEAMKALSPSQVSQLAPAQIASLPPQAFAVMAPNQARSLRARQITRYIGREKVRVIPSEALRAMRPRTLNSFKPWQLRALTAEQARQLRKAQIKRLGPTKRRVVLSKRR